MKQYEIYYRMSSSPLWNTRLLTESRVIHFCEQNSYSSSPQEFPLSKVHMSVSHLTTLDWFLTTLDWFLGSDLAERISPVPTYFSTYRLHYFPYLLSWPMENNYQVHSIVSSTSSTEESNRRVLCGISGTAWNGVKIRDPFSKFTTSNLEDNIRWRIKGYISRSNLRTSLINFSSVQF